MPQSDSPTAQPNSAAELLSALRSGYAARLEELRSLSVSWRQTQDLPSCRAYALALEALVGTALREAVLLESSSSAALLGAAK
jgi:hypothetical protein